MERGKVTLITCCLHNPANHFSLKSPIWRSVLGYITRWRPTALSRQPLRPLYQRPNRCHCHFSLTVMRNICNDNRRTIRKYWHSLNHQRRQKNEMISRIEYRRTMIQCYGMRRTEAQESTFIFWKCYIMLFVFLTNFRRGSPQNCTQICPALEPVLSAGTFPWHAALKTKIFYLSAVLS